MKRLTWLVVAICGSSCGNDPSGFGNSLTSTSSEPPGANCAAGGLRVDSGQDADNDGTLDPEEIASTEYSCFPGGSLVTTTPEAPGANCAFGGQRVDHGLDDNGNGVLDAAEIDGTTFLCNGGDGAQGSLVNTSGEEPGVNCVNGGIRIDHGIDDNDNGSLDTGEIDGTAFVCDGDDGLRALARTSAEAAGDNCVAGGTRVESGIDTNDDSSLDAGEVTRTGFLCNGLTSLVASANEPAGTNCADGGIQLTMGVDLDDSGQLDPGEVATTAFVCNGATGPGGFDALVDQTPEGAGPNCEFGGTRITSGLDSNDNGALDLGEVANTGFACDEADGSDGAPGTPGFDSLVLVSQEAPGPNCITAGARIDTGLDLDDDGFLDVGEITDTSFACNAAVIGMFGADSSNGNGAGGNFAGGNFYSIDQTTGIATVVAPLADSFSAMAFDDTGVLYAISRSTGELKTIDPGTGAVTTIGQTGSLFMDMAFDKTTGVMFAHSGPDGLRGPPGVGAADSTLRTVNLATGATTIVGSPGFSCGGGLAVRDDGTMFSDNRCVGAFGTVNKSTGALTPIHPQSGQRNFNAMTFSNGILFVIDHNFTFGGGGPARSLATFDVVTGVKTIVGAGNGLSAKIDALASP